MNVPPRFLAIGECMAELAPLEVAGDYRLGYAGDTFNTAWYVRQLRPDMDVSYYSAVGTDGLSSDMLGFMAEAGIGTEHLVRRSDRSVGLYMISLSEGERSFSYWRDLSAARLLTEDTRALASAIDAADVIYFSGITLAILDDVGRKVLLGALEQARRDGRTIIFDPNLRPRLWPNPDLMLRAVTQGAEISDIVLPSFEDEAVHFGDADPQATIRRYAQAGATCVIVKNGGEPVHSLHGGETTSIPVSPVAQVIDTTSAGDSFNAGFISTLDTEHTFAERIAMANSVASQVVGGKGALVPLDLKQVDHYPLTALVR